MSKLRVYFAGSIRGGREDLPIYQKLIAHLQKTTTVLTEHIGKPSLEAMGEMDVTDDFIYKRDMDWLKSCHVLIAEVTRPSLGVGYELGQAEAMGLQVLCLYRPQENTRLSAMIRGNPKFQVHDYSSVDQAIEIIDKVMAEVKPE